MDSPAPEPSNDATGAASGSKGRRGRSGGGGGRSRTPRKEGSAKQQQPQQQHAASGSADDEAAVWDTPALDSERKDTLTWQQSMSASSPQPKSARGGRSRKQRPALPSSVASAPPVPGRHAPFVQAAQQAAAAAAAADPSPSSSSSKPPHQAKQIPPHLAPPAPPTAPAAMRSSSLPSEEAASMYAGPDYHSSPAAEDLPRPRFPPRIR